jgi:YihY family inner membrane protein
LTLLNPTVPESRWRRVSRLFQPTLRYWMETEVHVYAFSVAACVLLSLFPFLIVIGSFFRYVLKWRAAADAIRLALGDYFPEPVVDFIQRNLEAAVSGRGTAQVVSLVLLLFVANGIFEPLEVAQNRVWGVPRHRSFLKNQLVSMGLIFICGGLALLSTVITTLSTQLWGGSLGARTAAGTAYSVTVFKMAALPMSMLMLFLVYWLLPNRKIAPLQVLPAAVVVGLALELLKYLNLLSWPLLRAKLAREYGPFLYSASILLWGFLGAMIVMAGAEWSARRAASRLQNAIN